MKIIVDLMGGDNTPDEVIEGCVAALNGKDNFELVLVGKACEVESKLIKHRFDPKRIEIVNSTEIITNNDVPTHAINNKKDSSMVLGLNRLASDEESVAFISSGSTGALLAGSIFKIGRIDGISRPALAPLLPALNGKNVLLLDCGANVDCKPVMLLHFAIMGSAYISSLFDIPNPKVALLNNGTESSKGNQLAKEAFPLLSGCNGINFVGNIEARDLLSGDYDVIVADGFSGNIALKTCEGTALTLLKTIKNSIGKNLRSKIGGLLLKRAFKDIKKTMDYNERGGALLCGLNKVVIKIHGSARASSYTGAIYQAASMYERKLIENIKERISVNESSEPKKEELISKAE